MVVTCHQQLLSYFSLAVTRKVCGLRKFPIGRGKLLPRLERS